MFIHSKGLDIVEFGLTEADEQVIHNKLDVQCHLISIHANQGNGKCFGDEVGLNFDSTLNDATYGERRCRVKETFVVDVYRKVPV